MSNEQKLLAISEIENLLQVNYKKRNINAEIALIRKSLETFSKKFLKYDFNSNLISFLEKKNPYYQPRKRTFLISELSRLEKFKENILDIANKKNNLIINADRRKERIKHGNVKKNINQMLPEKIIRMHLKELIVHYRNYQKQTNHLFNIFFKQIKAMNTDFYDEFDLKYEFSAKSTLSRLSLTIDKNKYSTKTITNKYGKNLKKHLSNYEGELEELAAIRNEINAYYGIVRDALYLHKKHMNRLETLDITISPAWPGKTLKTNDPKIGKIGINTLVNDFKDFHVSLQNAWESKNVKLIKTTLSQIIPTYYSSNLFQEPTNLDTSEEIEISTLLTKLSGT